MTRVCPECDSEDLARYTKSGMGRDIKESRKVIDAGCIDSGYSYHCWGCGSDIYEPIFKTADEKFIEPAREK